MHRSALLVLLVVAGLALSCGCGGGSGPAGTSGITTGDVEGSWFGPVGTATPEGVLTDPAVAGAVTIDAAGGVTGTLGLAGLTGVLTDQQPLFGILDFSGTGAWTGVEGILMVGGDTAHMLLIASDGTFAALQRDATELLPPYVDAEYRDAAWSGHATDLDAAYDAILPDAAFVTIDTLGILTAGTAATNLLPLQVFDPLTGELRGDYTDSGPPPEVGKLLALLTPDRAFMALLWCPTGAVALSECACMAIERD